MGKMFDALQKVEREKSATNHRKPKSSTSRMKSWTIKLFHFSRHLLLLPSNFEDLEHISSNPE